MRLSTILVSLAAVSYASASTLLARQANLPVCAEKCYGSTTSSCGTGNEVCLCNDTTFITAVEGCIEGACSSSDASAALTYAAALCKAVGVTIPTSSVPIPTSSGGSGSSTTSGSPTTSGSTTKSSSSTSSASTSSAPPATTSTSSAASHGPFINAIGGLVAIGIAALAL